MQCETLICFSYFVGSVIRHKLASEGPFDATDKFRIDIYIDKKLVGRKQVLSTLVKRKLTGEVKRFHRELSLKKESITVYTLRLALITYLSRSLGF